MSKSVRYKARWCFLALFSNKKQKLPTNLKLIQGLSKQIADLRVQIFDITQKRNELYDIDAYISKIEQDENKSFTPGRKKHN